MFSKILDKYNPKDRNSHGVLKYFSENLEEQDLIQFISEVFVRGSLTLPTEICRSQKSLQLTQITSKSFHDLFARWVDDRIEYSTNAKHLNITKELHLGFQESLLSIKNLDFPIESLKILETLIVNSNTTYLTKFLEGASWIVIEQYDEKDIERVLTFFATLYIDKGQSSIETFLGIFLNQLALSHKSFYLTEEFLSLLTTLSLKHKESLHSNDFKRLKTILVIELIQNKKLDLSKSEYNTHINAAVSLLEKGEFDCLDFFKFLKRFNYSFNNFNVNQQIQSLIGKISDHAVLIPTRHHQAQQSLLLHFLGFYNKYFELFLFYLEKVSEDEAIEHFTNFAKAVDALRTSFKSILWYEEFLNFKPITGNITSLTKSGFEVKINQDEFHERIDKLNLTHLLTSDFIKHCGYGFLNQSTLNNFPNIRHLYSDKKKNLKSHEIDGVNQISYTEGLNKFYILKLSYSSSQKNYALILNPYKESINKIVEKYKPKALFPVLELFLIAKSSSILALRSPLLKKTDSFKLLVLPNYLQDYSIHFSEEKFWEMLETVQPDLYNTIYVKHFESLESYKKLSTAFKLNQSLRGTVKCKTKDGLVIKIFDVEAFLPGSHVDLKAITDYSCYIGQTLDVKVIKTNNSQTNFVVSRKAILESDIHIKKRSEFSKIKPGQVVEGVVTSITSFGVFVEIGGFIGLLHKSNISWDNEDINTLLKINDLIKVVILNTIPESYKIDLGLKQLSKPKEHIKNRNSGNRHKRQFPLNSIHVGVIIKIEDDVAEICLSNGVEVYCLKESFKNIDTLKPGLVMNFVVSDNSNYKKTLVCPT